MDGDDQPPAVGAFEADGFVEVGGEVLEKRLGLIEQTAKERRERIPDPQGRISSGNL